MFAQSPLSMYGINATCHVLHGIFSYCWVIFGKKGLRTFDTWSFSSYCISAIKKVKTAGDHPCTKAQSCPFVSFLFINHYQDLSMYINHYHDHQSLSLSLSRSIFDSSIILIIIVDLEMGHGTNNDQTPING